MRSVHFALRLGYDGQPFCGWQRRAHPSVAQAILDAAPYSRGPRLLGALAQTPGFTLVTNVLCSPGTRVDAQRLMIALNARLPAQVNVYESAEVGPDWHPKQGVFGKRVYRIWCGGAAPCSSRSAGCAQVTTGNLDTMNQAAELPTGEQDFELSLDALPSSACGAEPYLRAKRNITTPTCHLANRLGG